jgi:capsular exopolysaccharide synthesis family protein
MSKIFEALQQSGVDLVALVEQGVDEFAIAPPATTVSRDRECGSFSVANSAHLRLAACNANPNLGTEQLRILATKMIALQQRSPFKRLLITSSMRAEGKSLLTANIAITLAKQSQRVLLLDCDLRRPSIEEVLSIPPASGLCDWDASEPVWKFIRKEEHLPLWLLSCGKIPSDPLQVLQSRRLPELFQQLEEHFDWIIIDSPPQTSFADTRVLGSVVEKIALIARQGATPKKLLQRCIDSVDKGKLLGVILNDANVIENTYYNAYYRPRSSDGATGKRS